jgi:hypothetical protein
MGANAALWFAGAAFAASTAQGMDQQRSANNKAEDAKKAASVAADKAYAMRPQDSKTPDYQSFKKGSGVGGPGPDTTLLTGLGGVDPKTLSLGRSTLLGA